MTTRNVFRGIYVIIRHRETGRSVLLNRQYGVIEGGHSVYVLSINPPVPKHVEGEVGWLPTSKHQRPGWIERFDAQEFTAYWFDPQIDLALNDYAEPPKHLKVGDSFDDLRNQAEREFTVLAVIGDEALCEYIMPMGTSAMLVYNAKTGDPMRNMSYAKVPVKWQEQLVKSAPIVAIHGCQQQSGKRWGIKDYKYQVIGRHREAWFGGRQKPEIVFYDLEGNRVASYPKGWFTD